MNKNKLKFLSSVHNFLLVFFLTRMNPNTFPLHIGMISDLSLFFTLSTQFLLYLLKDRQKCICFTFIFTTTPLTEDPISFHLEFCSCSLSCGWISTRFSQRAAEDINPTRWLQHLLKFCKRLPQKSVQAAF